MTFRTRLPETRKPSLVSAPVSALLSLMLPGLGQIMARSPRRGLTMLFSLISSAALLAWRIRVVARREVGFSAQIVKAYDLQPTLLYLTIAIALLYLWTVLDAYLLAHRPESGKAVGPFILILAVFFSLGWQISEIDWVSFATQLEDGKPTIMKIMWPWERALHYPEEYLIVRTIVEVPCIDEASAETLAPENEPTLRVQPRCGELTTRDTEGTTISVTGINLLPMTETAIWWKDPENQEFRQRQGGESVVVTTDNDGSFQVAILMPKRLVGSQSGRDYGAAAREADKWEVQARQLAAVGKAEWSLEISLIVEKMIETIFLGMMATFFGVIFAIPMSFLAARNLMSSSPLTLGVYYLVRTMMNIVRSIETIIWALIFVVIVGLGPFAGTLALTIHSVAALAKLYSEAIESIDSGPIEAIHATGANWVQTVVFAVIPQIVPPFVSFTIYRWDINVRMSTIIGLVGGGGIGFLLVQWIRLLDYRAAGIAVWFIAVTVAILDYVSAEIRERFI
ncbi:MAG: phosphonate ABC transporter, permease protein PhnE [Anaerolineaceae bacterium]|nr:phosphonate ABC transporter, permease protein PhnE [Anaerolineaceae bacterium]